MRQRLRLLFGMIEADAKERRTTDDKFDLDRAEIRLGGLEAMAGWNMKNFLSSAAIHELYRAQS
jgi:hypothetical protein